MKICSEHRDYEVPLIYTYSWAYNEYWCPYCDKHEGMLGAGEEVPETKELKDRLELFKKATAEYRHAIGVSVCSGTTWKGEMIKPEDLPDEEKLRLKKIREEGWKLNMKIENLKLQV